MCSVFDYSGWFSAVARPAVVTYAPLASPCSSAMPATRHVVESPSTDSSTVSPAWTWKSVLARVTWLSTIAPVSFGFSQRLGAVACGHPGDEHHARAGQQPDGEDEPGGPADGVTQRHEQATVEAA